MSDTHFFGTPLDLLGKLLTDSADLQARVQELEDRERLETPCTRIAALEKENADLVRRITQLETPRAAKQTTKRA